MTIKRFCTLFLLVGGVFFFSSCSNNQKRAKESANSFLTLYFQTDYDSAANFCTSELGSELKESIKSITSLEKGVKEMIVQQTSKMKTEITSVEPAHTKDSLIVNYKVILPSFPNGIDSKMVLVKREKEWLVASFGQSN
ncbi:MAG: hypothetical protein WC125_09730 [Bacteroidales bacterium]|nr:hypothetical protein [Bacteroidales bacterium]